MSLVVVKYILDKIKEKELKKGNISQASAEKIGFGTTSEYKIIIESLKHLWTLNGDKLSH